MTVPDHCSRVFVLFCGVLLSTPLLFADDRQTVHVVAVRTNEPIRIDGKLTESVWQRPGVHNFLQREPLEGAPPSELTEVWVAYDESAIYVAARMSDSRPDSIIGRLARRDADSESDLFGVGLDPAFDRRTGWYFTVNPVGSIQDGTYSNDTRRDDGWDGIWEASTQIDGDGWTAELRIPYSQLRFHKRDRYVWGIEFFRRIQRKNEEIFLTHHPRNDHLRVSRWAELHGIEDIEPPARIELLPYIAATGKFLQKPPVDPFNHGRSDPFTFGRDYFAHIGADVKIGLSGNITLDASLNPDFAQVEVDPAVVNLTAYEIQFVEKRPFFIEGSNILRFGGGGASYLQNFSWRDPNFFYSRRIGRAPQASVTHRGFANIPDRTTILGAAKVSGKVDDTWSIAALTAVTNREWGLVDSAGVRFEEEIEPLTFYGIVRTLKEFSQARHGLGVIATFTERDLREPRLQNLLNRRALSLGIDGWTFLDEEKDWVITGWVGSSHVVGTQARMLVLQRTPQHYFQRPDADHVELDPSATSLTGWAARVWLDKVKGNWMFNAAIGAITPGFETNDVGFLYNADYINGHIFAGYQWFEPDDLFRTKTLSLTVFRDYNFGGKLTWETFRLALTGQFLSYWNSYLVLGLSSESFDDRKTRGGPLMLAPPNRFVQAGLFSDTRKPLSGSLTSTAARNVEGAWWYQFSLGMNWKVTRTLTIHGGPEYYRAHALAQWITSIADEEATHTFGRRYIFGVLDQTTVSAWFRVNWTFTPRLSFQLYLQPLISTGSYTGIKELARPSSFSFNRYGEGASRIIPAGDYYMIDPDGEAGPAQSFFIYNPNFNFKSLRANAVFRWEFMPGSTLFFVWTNEKVDFQNSGEFQLGRDFRTLLRVKPDNVFSVKVAYWLNP